MEHCIVRYGDLVPCKTAFIDARTPGSDLKENYCIIGAGISESPTQTVHIRETPGFNIGAAGQPPHCKNSLHYHITAEAFFVLKGRWRFFWGLHGDAGEVVLEEGDIFNIPTGIFRGFENIGTDYGMIMSILGGDDAGGGVSWAPHVIQSATNHGLILGEDGQIYDSVLGESLPDGVAPMPLLGEDEVAKCPEPGEMEVVPNFVARYLDMMAIARTRVCAVIGPAGLIRDRPGFQVDFIARGSLGDETITTERHEILMIMRGHWRLDWDGGHTLLADGDTCALPPGLAHRIAPCMAGEASLFRIRNTDDPAGPTGY
jgi:mannose-6-phosphate isomerase-like protein (cupin superfamily)